MSFGLASQDSIIIGREEQQSQDHNQGPIYGAKVQHHLDMLDVVRNFIDREEIITRGLLQEVPLEQSEIVTKLANAVLEHQNMKGKVRNVGVTLEPLRSCTQLDQAVTPQVSPQIKVASVKEQELQEQVESLSIALEKMRSVRPGYSLLGKKRGNVARVLDIPEKLNAKILSLENDEIMHTMYVRQGSSRKLRKVEAPLQYKHTSPYYQFSESQYVDKKKVYFIEWSHELNCKQPGLKRKDIRALFNKAWPLLSQERREEYVRVASRLNHDPIKGVNPLSFNGIQFYKEELGIKTRKNPETDEPRNIHRRLIDKKLLREIERVEQCINEKKQMITCLFCASSGCKSTFKGLKKKYLKHLRRNHGRRLCEECNEQFQSGQDFAKHKQEFHQMKIRYCETCKQRFETTKQLRKHKQESFGSNCMHQCCKPDCSKLFASDEDYIKHVTKYHEELFQKIVYCKNGGYQYKFTTQEAREIEKLLMTKFLYESDEDYIKELQRKSQILICLFQHSELRSIALIGRKRFKDQTTLMCNHLCVKHERTTVGSRMIAELRHYSNRLRFTDIIANAIPSTLEFYEKQRFVKCDFQQKFKNAFCYIKQYPNTIPMISTECNFLRDRKEPWMWPKGFPECEGAADLRILIQDAIDKGDIEYTEELYIKKMKELKADRFQEAFESDQAWTHPTYFEIWYRKFRLLKDWFFDPCLGRRFWSSFSYFNALREFWGEGLIFLNHSWKTTRGFLPMMMKQFFAGASIVCIVTNQSLNCNYFKDVINPLCELDVMPPAIFGGKHKTTLDRPVMAIYLFQPELLNFLASKQSKKKQTDSQLKQTRLARNQQQIERFKFVEKMIQQKFTRKEIEQMSGVKRGDYDQVSKELKSRVVDFNNMIWGEERNPSHISLISEDISNIYNLQ